MRPNEVPTGIAEQEEERVRRVPLRRYVAVWAALTALTFLTLWLSRVNLGAWHVPVALVIASVKAFLVLLFFMHLWEARGTVPFVMSVTVCLLLLLIGLSITDLTGRFSVTLPQPALEHGAVR